MINNGSKSRARFEYLRHILIELVDENGRRLGVVAREIDLEDIRIARARLESDQPRLSYAAVLDHLHRLEMP